MFERFLTEGLQAIQEMLGSNEEAPPKRPMQRLDYFNSGQLPDEEMKLFTEQMNILILRYNTVSKDSTKIEILKQMQEKIQEIDYTYKPSALAASPEYQAIHAALFKEIKYQHASMGVSSVISSPKNSSPLSEVIANMPPEKMDTLLSILIKGKDTNLTAKNNELDKLYDSADNSEDAKQFRKFYQEHQIEYLGGGNSKNFKVTRLDDGAVAVLKIDCRLNMPRNVEAHLRDKLGDKFAPIYAERPATCNDKEDNKIQRTILVTEFCPGGNVAEHGNKLKSTPEKHAQNAGIIFQQIAKTMIDMQNAGCMFPDAKLTNWLVDENNKIRLADTKSFLFIDKDGKYSPKLPRNKHCGFLSTQAFKPPEFNDTKSMNADAVHAFILGKNLYTYATGNLNKIDDGRQFDFEKPFFKTPQGAEYRELIEKLVTPDPSQRMSMSEASESLFKISNPEFKNAFNNLDALKFGKNDKKMEQFILDKKNEIMNTHDPKEREKILAELETTVSNLKADKAAQGVRTMISDFRAKDGLFTVGMKAKANRIEHAMCGLSIEERCNFLSSKKSDDVMKAMASHRHLGKSEKVYLDKAGEIDTKKAAQSFKDFKNTYGSIKNKEPLKAELDQDHSDSNRMNLK